MDMSEYVRNNAGKAFEFMLEVVEADRKEQGLPDIATARAEAAEHPEVSYAPPSPRYISGAKVLHTWYATITVHTPVASQGVIRIIQKGLFVLYLFFVFS